MKSHRQNLFVSSVLMVAAVIVSSNASSACPFGTCCFRNPIPFAVHLANANVIALAERACGDEQAKQTVFVIRHCGGDGSEELNIGDSIVVPYFSKNDAPGLHFVFGGKDQAGQLQWQRLGAANKDRIKYLLGAPRPNVAAAQRLAYFLNYLESSDDLIAADAFLEVDSVEWNELVAAASQLPRDKLREWLRNPNTPPNRLGLYAKMLGICGNRTDVEFLLAHLRRPSNDFRIGLDGYNIAYLWRTGEKGLAVLDEFIVDSSNIPFSERYAVMVAIRFMMEHSSERISLERACESMRLRLDDPELTDLAIADLTRWKDWSVQDRLMSLYGQGEYNQPAIKKAIVRYLVSAGQIAAPFSDDPKKLNEDVSKIDLPSHISQARVHVGKLCERDLKTVQQVERFMVLK